MNFPNLISELAATIQLPSFTFDENHCACLVVDETWKLNFEFDPAHQLLHIYYILGEYAEDATPTFFSGLLKANLFGQQTGLATIALDEAKHEVVLHRTLTGENWDVSSFTKVLEQFLSAIKHLKPLIDTQTHSSANIPNMDCIPDTSFDNFLKV